MRTKTVIAAFLMVTMLTPLAYAQGLIGVKSSHDVATTADRLESALSAKGITVFARIDHAAGARQIGQTLEPTLLIIFGSPTMGTPLIERSRTIGIDLPLKALIWQDRAGQVWLTYNDPAYLASRHGITEMDEAIVKMQQALSTFAMAATLP